jgi:hypothetical protein
MFGSVDGNPGYPHVDFLGKSGKNDLKTDRNETYPLLDNGRLLHGGGVTFRDQIASDPDDCAP